MKELNSWLLANILTGCCWKLAWDVRKSDFVGTRSVLSHLDLKFANCWHILLPRIFDDIFHMHTHTHTPILQGNSNYRLNLYMQVLVIAHRLETVLMAERVFLLEDGYLQEVPRASLLDSRSGSLASMSLTIWCLYEAKGLLLGNEYAFVALVWNYVLQLPYPSHVSCSSRQMPFYMKLKVCKVL